MAEAQKELRAVLGRAKPARDVAARDFKRPRRLGQEFLDEVRLKLTNLLPALEKRLAEGSGLRVELELARLGEADAEGLFAAASEPLCVLRFRVGHEPAWLVWEPSAAVSVVETIFGARASAGTARKLSPSEVKVASMILAEIVRALTGALKLTASEFALVQVPTELGSWREGGAEAEAYRFEIDLDLVRGEQRSTLRLYLPGVSAPAAAVLSLPDELPAHLERVEVELSARLPGCEISLDQLLALEEGDVIPLDARLGDLTVLCVEGLNLAQGRLGSHRGRLAVRIERLSVEPEASA